MNTIDMQNLPDDVHLCESDREGDWIVWRCTQCAGYERRINWVTGEMRAQNTSSTILHSGSTRRALETEAFQQGFVLN
jgi:hypothetical protein